MAAAGYYLEIDANNKTTITQYSTATLITGIWVITGHCQLRVLPNGDNSDAEYRVCQAGVQDIVMPYSQINMFAGETAPTDDPIADVTLFAASFPVISNVLAA